MRIFISIGCFLLLSFSSQAQNELTFEAFMDLVRDHHPMAAKANIQPNRGEAQLLKAKGAFDPKLGGDIAQKYFEETSYYSLIGTSLKVPTWFGVELATGIDYTDGKYLNPQYTTPDNGLWYAGIKLPIGQGLFIDQRRAELKQARLFQESTLAQQKLMLADLYYQAGLAYWDWFLAHRQVEIYQEGVRLAEQRFRGLVQEAVAGDRPTIDTVEASIQLQNRRLSLQEAELNLQLTAANLQTYLWKDGFAPLEMDNGLIPQKAALPVNVETWEEKKLSIDSLLSHHPEVEQYRLKVAQLEIEQRLKREMLKPELNLKYNALSEPVNGNVLAEYSVNNYNWGMEFNMPLLLRKERAGVQLNQVKLSESEFDLSLKQQLIYAKFEQALSKMNISALQYEGYEQNVTDYFRLLNGERQKFSFGESSVFLVNSREIGYINAQLRLAESLVKNQKANLSINNALAIGFE